MELEPTPEPPAEEAQLPTKGSSAMKDFRGRFVTRTIKPFKCSKGHMEVEVVVEYRCLIPGCGYHCHKFSEFFDHFGVPLDDQHRKYSPFREMTQHDLYLVLESTIKRDEETACITFDNMLLAQTEKWQFNVIPQAVSSSGKTYIILQDVEYFPRTEIVRFAGASPTSFIHENGAIVLENEDGSLTPAESVLTPLLVRMTELRKKGDEKSKRTADEEKEIEDIRARIATARSSTKHFVDLKNKIVILLDQNSLSLMERLRPLMSHDLDRTKGDKYYRFSITDKSTTGSNRTKHVLIEGNSSIFLCTVSGTKIDEQEISRAFFTSPQISGDKITEGVKFSTARNANTDRFSSELENNLDRRCLMLRIELIRTSGKVKFVLEDSVAKMVEERFMSLFTQKQPKEMRDYDRMFSLIYANALLNTFTRSSVDNGTLKAEQRDVDEAFKLFEPFVVPTELGVTPETYRFLLEVLVPYHIEKANASPMTLMSSGDMIRECFARTEQSPSEDTIEKRIKSLLARGVLQKRQDPENRRSNLYLLVESNPSVAKLLKKAGYSPKAKPATPAKENEPVKKEEEEPLDLVEEK